MNNLNTDTDIHTESIDIERGISQGGLLRALWFCLCLNSLLNSSNNTTYGFQIKHHKLRNHSNNHLIYRDGIKIFAQTKTQMSELLKIADEIRSYINMEYGINKCKMLIIERGRWKEELTT